MKVNVKELKVGTILDIEGVEQIVTHISQGHVYTRELDEAGYLFPILNGEIEVDQN